MSLSPDREDFVDPDQPPSRPSSVLSGSGDSFVNYSDGEEEDVESPAPLNPRQVASTLRRDNSRCILCRKQDGLQVYRLVGQDNDDANPSLLWLQGFKFIPAHYDRDNIANLMTLCDAHVATYRARVWRLLPCAEFRKGMLARTPLRGDALQQRNRSASPQLTLPNAQSTLFDVLVFLPELMPPLSPTEPASSRKSRKKGKRAPPPGLSPRVLPSLLSLQIDPYIAYASALEMIGKAYWPPPDEVLRLLEVKCLEIRRRWNNSL
ncbi:hypothetical protein A0H81_05328 [Grifola frondosa]|uniref:Uncharacterized protein n=1 Tax=Grifola frondosa TaxID=5627 RepID=A0A1C7ME78_GRIFR|nr:hypothetical protein A0H81_05328 [Grifola frondosa]